MASFAKTVLRRERRFWRLLTVLLVLALLTGSVWASWSWIQARRHARWAQFAAAELAAGDLRAATMWATRLNQVDPRGLPSASLRASVADATNRPEAVLLRARVAQLKPGDTGALLAWAKSALRGNQHALAERALSLVPEGERNTLSFHTLSAALCVATNRFARAEGHFLECQRLEPAVVLHKINLAALQLRHPEPEKAAAARQLLEQVAEEKNEHRPLVLRALTQGLLDRGNDLEGALKFARLLAAESGAMGDRMLLLESMRRAGSADFKSTLTERCAEALKSPGAINPLVEWMNSRELTAEARAWLASIPDVTGLPVQAQMSFSDTFVRSKDWLGLREFLAPLQWARYEFLRRALLARVTREQDGNTDAFRDLWRSLMADLNLSAEDQSILASVTKSWGWMEQTEALWLQVGRGAAAGLRPAALQNLFDLHRSRGATEQLLATVQEQMSAEVDNPVHQNNFAYLSLLRGANLPAAHRLAADLATKYPQNNTILSTYAFSLWQQGKALEGTRALAGPDGKRTADPSLAFTLALLLEAGGHADDARKVIPIAERQISLPEEKKVLQSLSERLRKGT